MVSERLAPPGSTRRLAVQLLKHGLHEPRGATRRLRPANLSSWWRFRRTTITCNVCGHSGPLLYEMHDVTIFDRLHIGVLRETLRCRACLSRMRDRTMAAALLDVMATHHGVEATTIEELATRMPPGLRLLDTDANGRIARLLSGVDGVVQSLFVPGLASGATVRDGVLNVDLEQMPFDDSHFDVIMTTEVMEHVRYVDTAHREVARCLRSDGHYLFTVPYDEALAETWTLVDPLTDEDLVDLPHIHGDAGMREEGIRSYRVFGRDIVDALRGWGLDARFERVQRPDVGIFDGDLFTATRA